MQDIRLNNPAQVRRLLSRTINQLLRDETNEKETNKARCIGYLCTVLLKAIEVEDVVKRIEDIEKQLAKEGK